MNVADLVRAADPKNPTYVFPQAVNHLLSGVPMRSLSWPEGRFVVLAPIQENTDVSGPAFYMVEPGAEVGVAWVPTLADINARYAPYRSEIGA